MKNKSDTSNGKRRLKMSALLLSMALFTITAMAYAWFFNNTATSMSGADMNVDEVLYLSIRGSSSDEWSTSLGLTIDGVTLSPIKSDGSSFQSPVIELTQETEATVTNGEVYRKKVTGYTNIANPDAMTFVKDFQLMFQENTPVSISAESEFLDAATGQTASIAPALRMAIYQNTGTEANPVYTLKKVWKTGDGQQAFASLTKNQPSDFCLRIWLEGTDSAANNLNCGEQILLNLKFLAN